MRSKERIDDQSRIDRPGENPEIVTGRVAARNLLAGFHLDCESETWFPACIQLYLLPNRSLPSFRSHSSSASCAATCPASLLSATP